MLNQSDKLFELAQNITDKTPGFFDYIGTDILSALTSLFSVK